MQSAPEVLNSNDLFDEKSFSTYDQFEIDRYRLTLDHQVLVKILQEGYHHAYKELFNLLKNNKELADVPDVLYYIKDMLVSAEYASRRGNFTLVYNAQHSLAKFFKEKNYNMLVGYFYKICYETSCKMRGDGKNKEAESNFDLGTYYEQEYDIQAAKRYYKRFVLLSKGKNWKFEDGTLFYETACEALQRLYVTEVRQLNSVADKEEILTLLDLAYTTAKEGGSIKCQCEVVHFIGQYHDNHGDHNTAIKYHEEHLSLSQSINDSKAVAKAYQSLANASERNDDIEGAKKYLETFLNEAEKSGDVTCMFEANRQHGALHNSLGNYTDAVTYYKKAIELSNNQDGAECCLCEYAVAMGNSMQAVYLSKIVINTNVSVRNVSKWKSKRKGFEL